MNANQRQKEVRRFYNNAANVVEVYFFEDNKVAKVFRSEAVVYAVVYRQDANEFQFRRKANSKWEAAQSSPDRHQAAAFAASQFFS
jgi:hypothetical protein